MKNLQITLPWWLDLHMHARQGGMMLRHLLAEHLKMGCAGIIAMPNTDPAVSQVFSKGATAFNIEIYADQLRSASGGVFEHIIVPLYLSKDTTPAMIEQGAESGKLISCKYYPPHGTTNSAQAMPLQYYIDNGVLQAMSDNGVPLNIHGERHGIKGKDYYDKETSAEITFYKEEMEGLRDIFPDLKIVCEHITTEKAVNFVKESSDNIVATVTPQHLLYTVAYILQGLKYHAYCLPLLKFEKDRQALLNAVTSQSNTKFFAGTDSAPHDEKVLDNNCGCAAGCFTGGIAPQLYAQAFEEHLGGKTSYLQMESRLRATLKQFMVTNGSNFYGLSVSTKTFDLVKQETAVKELILPDGKIITPLPVGMNPNHAKEGTTIPWKIEL